MSSLAENGNVSFLRKTAAFIELGRAPFLSVGILPFILGSYLGALAAGRFDVISFSCGLGAVITIMLTTYFFGEYFDNEGDEYGATRGKNQFSGGSLIVQKGILGRKIPLIAGIITAAVSVILGLYLIFFRGGGWQALAMGAFGIISGAFYSAKPFRWVDRGIGEILIGICYGWLPVAVAYWLQAQSLGAEVHWVAIPIAFTIFNVILINEFPDFAADSKFGKRNITVRFGKPVAAVIYGVAGLLAAAFLFVAVWRIGYPPLAYAIVALPALLAVVNSIRVFAGHYNDEKKLEQICGVGIVINLLCAIAFIAVAFFYG